MTKYRTYLSQIETVEVDRETESSVWVDGRCHRKTCEWDSFHDTFEQAKAHLVRLAQEDVEKARRQLDRATQQLAKVEAMTPVSKAAQ